MTQEHRISRPSRRQLRKTREVKQGKRQDLNRCRLSETLRIKKDDDEKDDALSAVETTGHRRIAAPPNFLAQDRMDIAYAVEEATRRKTATILCPTVQSCELLRAPRSIEECRGMHKVRLGLVQKDTKLDVWPVHSQRAAYRGKTQAIVALSSAESESDAAVKAGQEILGVMSLWKDLGQNTQRHVTGNAI